MTTQNNLEENKRIVRAFIETAFNQHQTDRVGDHLTADMKWHGGTLGTVEGLGRLTGLGAPVSVRAATVAFVTRTGTFTARSAPAPRRERLEASRPNSAE